MQQEKRTALMLGLAEAFGADYLCDIRTGALLYHTRPELGRLLVEITAPDAPSDANDELREAVLRLVSSDDNILQAVIELLEGAQEFAEKED